MSYLITDLQADIAQVQHDQAGFGSGRLVAENLVLTAAHTLRNEAGTEALDGWQVRLVRDSHGDRWPFRRANRVAWWSEKYDLALIVLVAPKDGPVRPKLSLRVAKVSSVIRPAVEARGYPRAGKSDDRRRELIPVLGRLAAGEPDQPLFFGVDASDLPAHPHEDWPGLSGSAVILNDWSDRKTIWIYGVVQKVPAHFDGQLRISRLAAAWEEDAAFRALLARAGAPDEEAEDPISPKKPIGPNPYKGLLYFDEGDADRFFGRENLTEALYARLTLLLDINSLQPRVLPVLGPSGSGKSSLVRAGLVPRLRRAPLAQWGGAHIAVFTPGTRPLAAMAHALIKLTPEDANAVAKEVEYTARLTDHPDGLRRIIDDLCRLGMSRLILVIDQFEELYVTPAARNERKSFEAQRDRLIATLLDAAVDSAGALLAVIVLRSDFFGATQRHPELNAQIARSDFLVPAMSKDELKDAIRKPPERTQPPYKFPEAFVDLLIREVIGQPGALPMLQFALQRVWDALPADPAATLDRLGGVGGAVAVEADSVFGRLSPEHQSIARRAFLFMVNIGEETADTRRRGRLEEISAGPEFEDEEWWVLGQFARPDARLITLSQEPSGGRIFEIAHEALIRRWDRLQKWLQESRDDLRLQHRAREAAALWNEGKGDVWRSFQLEQLRAFAARAAAAEMPALLSEFLNASLKAKTDAELRDKRHRRAVRSWAIAATGLLFIVLVGSVYLAYQLDTERRATFLWLVEQAERATQAKDYLQALQVAIRTWEMPHEADPDYDQRTYEVMRETLTANQRLARIMQHDGPVWAVRFSRSGELIATGSKDNTARLWDVATGGPVGKLMQHKGAVDAIAFDPRGRFLATASEDGTAQLWDARTGEPIGKPMQHGAAVTVVAFDPEGDLLATASGRTARLWDARTGEPEGRPMQHDGIVTTLAFDSTGDRLATGSLDTTARVWKARTGEIIGKPMQHARAVRAVAFDADGQLVATGSDEAAQLWNAGTGEPVGKPMSRGAPVWAVAFDPHSEVLLTGSGDRTARLWKVPAGEQLGKAMQHDGPVKIAAFDPTGNLVLTGSLDNTARLWDTRTGDPVSRPLQHTGGITAVDFDPKEAFIVTASEDGTIKLWSRRAAEAIERPMVHSGPVNAVIFDPGGRFLATGSDDQRVRLWDARTGDPICEPMPHNGPVTALAFDRKGNLLATASEDQKARLWDIPSCDPIGKPMPHDGPVTALAFAPKGNVLATASEDQKARLWDIPSCDPIGKPMQHGGSIRAVAFDRMGELVVTASDDETARLWNGHTGDTVGQPMRQHDGITAVAFNPTGTRVATGAGRLWKDNTALLWDVGTSQQVGRPMRHGGNVVALAFDPTGELLATGTDDNKAQLWNAHTGEPVGAEMEHDGPVRTLAFDHGDRLLATGSDDGSLRLWNAHSGEPVGKPMKHSGPVRAVAFDPNGEVLATGSLDNAELWLALPPQTLFNRGRAILGAEANDRTQSPSPDFVSWIEKKIHSALHAVRSFQFSSRR